MATELAKVAVVIAARGKANMTRNAIRGIKRAASGHPLEIVLVEHNTNEVKAALEESHPDVRVIQVADGKGGVDRWSFSTLNNHGVKATSAPYVLLLNNDAIPKEGMVGHMVEVLETKPEVGVVGAKLLFPQGTIQHIGVIFSNYGVPHHIGWGKEDGPEYMPSQRSGYFDAVTFACALTRRSLWDQLGGLDEDYFFNYEDVDFCLRARELGHRCFVTHAAVALHLESQSADFQEGNDHTKGLRIFRDKWIFGGRLEKVIGSKINDRSGPLHDERKNIAFIPLGPDNGVGWWRIENVAKMMSEKGLANTEVIYGTSNEGKLMRAVERADLMIWQGHFDEVLKRIAAGGELRTFRMIYEYDDHPIYLSPFAQVYEGLGTKEFYLQPADGSEGHWLWRDGERGFDLERNRRGRQNQIEIMTLSDALTTTTEALRAYFTTLNKNVFVLPNSIDFRSYAAPKDRFERKPGPIRIGWWGGDNHWHDWASIGPWVVDFVNSHDVRLVLLGAFYRGPLKGIDENKVENIDWVKIDAFPWRLATAALDVAIIPLANPAQPDFRFNNFKSDIKWLEASALKWPSLVQGGMRAYENCEDGVNALTYLTEAEFKEKLEALCADAALRDRIASAAHDWVREHRDLEKNIHLWADAYLKVIATQPSEQDIAAKYDAAVPEAALAPAQSGAVAEAT